jgi:hypothetical protein
MLSQNPESWGSWTHEQPFATEPVAVKSNAYDMYPHAWAPELGEVQPPKPTAEDVSQNRTVQLAVEASLRV